MRTAKILGLMILMVLAIGVLRAEDKYKIIKDIEYAQISGVDDKYLSLDVYQPLSLGWHPVIFYVHGGGWTMGDKDMDKNKGKFFAESGFVFVSANYRLSPAVKHPAHIEDVARAYAWTHNNIRLHGGNPDKIFVMGHSSGAHLVALLATDEKYLKDRDLSLKDIEGAILLDGAGYNIPELKKTSPQLFNTFYAAAFGKDQQTLKNASPFFHISSGKHIPPFLVVYVDRKASKPQAKAMVDKLADSGVKAELFFAENRDHLSLDRELGDDHDPTTQAIVNFLENILKD